MPHVFPTTESAARGRSATSASRPGAGDGPPRSALVTGASSGIGAAVARRLAAENWRLVLNGRDETRLAAVTAQVSAQLSARVPGRAHGSAVAFPADLTAPGGGPSLADFVLDRVGPPALLVASAGIGWAGDFATMPREAIEEVVAADLLATLHLVRRMVPPMAEAGTGRIVLIGSVAGSLGVRGEAVYSAAKAGIGAFADALRYELKDAGVGVTHVIPGAVDTPFFDRRGVPYQRSRPRPVSCERVADAVWNAVRRGKDEVYVPGWLRLPTRMRGVAPAMYRRLAARFG
ncbi:SDR family NAD(P)-dependent oxidoreductase [Streptomyces sp. J2-1]|uniref:SDR family NAD(P)-dependent oxidoreductase n=1 Tax=Streptomyces corallincola TaxID=2851888 RepID=UPI001C395139|nr:SDR family NAD(P)-dependent oxidoreductase [Streptomyces corallincola]MBV2354014.1 SDR family NAD(P)-dependent oxidoreductase [Streptomyces corallincola]